MKRWTLVFTHQAERDLARLDGSIRRRVIKKLDEFIDHFEVSPRNPLTGDLGEFFKLRIGDWRIVYKISWDNGVITICYIDHRDKIYKR